MRRAPDVGPETSPATGERPGADLRMPVLGAVAWAGALVGLLAPAPLAVLLTGVGLALLVAAARRDRAGLRGTLVAAAVVLLAATAVAGLHRAGTATGPVPRLAAEEASVRGVLQVTGDPRLRQGTYGDYVVLRGDLVEVTGRGRSYALSAGVLLVAPPGWEEVELGSRVALAGRLAPADGDLAGVLRVRGEAELLDSPDVWWDGAALVRGALRESVAHRPDDQAVLVPSLVVGDDAGLDPDLSADFQTTGLTHLLAVSGTNLTLIVGFLLVLARVVGVRGRGRYAVAAFGIVGFVLLARTEPSVVRAAAMGTVALLGMGHNGLRRGTRSLGVAVVVLLLVQPWLAVTVGFALSVLATAGILFLAPTWRDALARWMPRWLAEAVAVPAAAQLACTPVVAAISGQVSLVAVLANMLVAPVVGPATVLGLAGGLVGLLSAPLSRIPGTLASWCVAWIIAVAERGAVLPAAAVGWGTSVLAVGGLTVLCAGLAVVAPRLLRRPVRVVVATALAVAAVVVRVPDPGWPPSGWAAVACDVGQGDGIVLRVAEGVAVVVDTGPDPVAIDRCLDDLRVERVALLVLTHFHDDHAGAVDGVLDGRAVDAIEVSPLPEPPATATAVAAAARARGVPVSVPGHGSRRTIGDVSLEVLWPEPGVVRSGGGERDGEGSNANDASLVLLAEVRGVSLLLTGDVEPPAQRRLLRTLRERSVALDVDVLKVPHHGSRHQDLDLLTHVRPEVALVPVGADNTYGHPNPGLLGTLESAGAVVARTDVHGDVAVVTTEGRAGPPGVVTRRRAPSAHPRRA
ncbi:ComEC/Rec2 family competence protein [Nocardioides zeae]|uniref:ComEC/Rec2 family competence protein n=1 Tax=Nocardioides imazamoxiresistens TaxID=3231893 RepID=A0ABU3Q1D7_9ACTN|nr:ComEC/Rec2 family competence protein [Nocardioides zeae]MDT9595199.1 ComEC/Rec2 family competence protein [Nocardioides zeae]